LGEEVGKLIERQDGWFAEAVELNRMCERLRVETAAARVDDLLYMPLNSFELTRLLEVETPLRPIPRS